MGSTANPRRITWRRDGSVDVPPARPYDVCIPDEHAILVRERAAKLSAEDPGRFFAVVRDAQQREIAGSDSVTALEEALDEATATE